MISETTKLSTISEDDQHWLFNTLAPEAIRNGLRQMAIVGMDKKSLFSNKTSALDLQIFDTIEEAFQWMKETL